MKGRGRRRDSRRGNRREYKRIIHSKRWSVLRRQYMAAHPFCEECMAAGVLDVAAEEVHHVKPIGTGRDFSEMCALAFDWGNLRALCHDCHVKAHQSIARRGHEVSEGLRDWLRGFGV